MIHSQIHNLTAILTGGLSRKSLDGVDFSQANWSVLMPYLEKNGLLAIASDAFLLYRKNGLPLPPLPVRMQAQQAALALDGADLADSMAMRKLCQQWNNEGRRMLALGGSAFSLIYPNPRHNGSSTLDYFPVYSGKDVSMAQPADESSLPVFKHIKLNQVASAVGNLTKERADEHSAVLQEAFSEAPCVTIPTMGYMMPNLQFCALHLLHSSQLSLINDSLSIRVVCDWAMLLRGLSREGVKFDWSGFWQRADRLGLLNFGATLSALAVQLVGVDLVADATPAPAHADDAAVLLRHLLDAKEQPSADDGRARRFFSVLGHHPIYSRFTNMSTMKEAFQQLFSKE